MVKNRNWLKDSSPKKSKSCHHLFTLKMFQTCMSFFLLLSTKEDKDTLVNKLMVVISFLFWFFFVFVLSFLHIMEVNGYRQLCDDRICHFWANYPFKFPFILTYLFRAGLFLLVNGARFVHISLLIQISLEKAILWIMDSYFRQFGLKWKMWITRGLLRCFYQLSGLSFWRHPFTAEDPLVNNNIMLHFSKTVIMKKQKALEMKKRMQLLSFECHHFCCRFGRAQDSAAGKC